ncbi:MAG: hypothetical protein GEU82_12365 [Luteitalea sp.]|nr:hypothetical protein [Luteitalea sp.]
MACVLASVLTAAGQKKVNPTGAQVKAFLDRVNAYVEMKQKLEDGLTPVSPSDRTSGVEQHRTALAERIRAARRGARQGDLFGATAALFREIIVRDSRTRSARDTGAVLEEVPSRSEPAVNAVYPEGALLATVPPLILTNLPPLPDGLEYRFMGHALILRDRAANLVVDFVPGAIPTVR